MFARAVLKLLRILLPESPSGDFFYSFISFYFRHKRFPSTGAANWNDRQFKFKVSTEIADPLRVFVSDKELVKIYVKSVIGDQYNIPTLKILRSAAEAGQASYPGACVVKATHLSGAVLLHRKVGDALDRERIASWFDQSHYQKTRERNYKALQPKVIVEPLVFGSLGHSDIRFLCNQGRARLIQVSAGRFIQMRRSYYDLAWKRHEFNFLNPETMVKDRLDLPPEPRPKNLKAMLRLAEALAKNFKSVVRIDMYSNGTQVKIGEITNCPGGVRNHFYPAGADFKMHSLVYG